MTVRHARVHARDFRARHLLGFRHGLLDGFDGEVDVHDHAAAQTARRRAPDADDIDAGADGP